MDTEMQQFGVWCRLNGLCSLTEWSLVCLPVTGAQHEYIYLSLCRRVSVIFTSHVPVYRWYWDYNAFNQKRIWWRQALVRAITQVLPSSNEQYIRVLEIFLITHCKTYFKNKSLIHYILEKACSSLTTLSHRSI